MAVAQLLAGPAVNLHIAGPLAVSPSGTLYVADVASHRILVRGDDGRFRVVAGDGRAGFSGDGGPAVDAELSDVSDLAFGPTGNLYIADGPRVRVVSPDGEIHTVAGNGTTPRPIADGTPALSAPLARLNHIAVSQDGQVYISTGSQILRLTGQGTLVTVPAVVSSGPLRGALGREGDLAEIALDASGDIYVSGFEGWSVWRVNPAGVASNVGGVGAARRSGGNFSVLARGPSGAVYAEDGPTIERAVGGQLLPAYSFTRSLRAEKFWLTYFAFGPDGVIYADDVPGGGAFEAHQQLVSVVNSRVSVLWEEGTG